MLLASKGEGPGTACWPGGNTYVDWTYMDAEGRPASFSKEDLGPPLLYRARLSQCDFSSCNATCSTSEQVGGELLHVPWGCSP